MAQRFGRYELLELLGRGGMGEVHRARDTERQREVALKLLPEHLAGDPKFMARFRRESRLAAQLSEPHIIPIHDFGEIDGRLFIDMRMVTGADLSDVLEQRGPLAAGVAVDILTQVASALDAAHAEGLVHRDVKPSNVMLTGLSDDLLERPPFAYLVDFGIARSNQQSTVLTDTASAAIGTVAYMSPERIGGALGDGRADVYALACVLYESLTGEPPFQGEVVSMIYQHMSVDPPRASARVPTVPAALDNVIARGMAKEPDDRYPSAGELAVAARRASAPSTLAGPATRTAPKVRPSPAPAPVPPPEADPGSRPPAVRRPQPRAALLESRSRETRLDHAARPGPPVREPARPTRTVTLLAVGADGSGRATGRATAAHAAAAGVAAAVLETSRAHGGVELDTGTGEFVAGFEQPSAAVDAATQVQLAARGEQTNGIRIGVHTGEVRGVDGSAWAFDVAYALRLASSAGRGQVLVSSATRSRVESGAFESLGVHSLPGFPSARAVYHLAIDGASAADFPPPRELDPPRSDLPTPSTPTVGRSSELADLSRRVSGEQRLLTLTGAGGSGKTRMSIEVARQVAPRFESVWFVPLDAITEITEVVPAIARAIGLPELADADPLERVIDNLRGRRVLLVLDNFEHVIDAADTVAAIVSATAGVHVLVTSQAPLRVTAEQVVDLDPLAVPDEDGEPAAVRSAPAVQLLLQCANAGGTALAVDETNAAVIVRLCRQLEGLPLAIELAAARLSTLEVLGPGGSDLAGRQPGLRAVLDWSVGLLDPAARRLLGDIAAFADGFSLSFAESAFGQASDPLATLVDVGLVRQADDGRFTLRPPVRRYAIELAGADIDRARWAVADALARGAEAFEPTWMLRGGEGRLWLNPETSNILAALEWTREHDAELHLRLAASTAWLLTDSGLAPLSRTHVELALGRSTDPRMRARCLQAVGVLDLATADPSASMQAADLWRDLGAADAEAVALALATSSHLLRGEPAGAAEVIERAHGTIATAADPEGIAWLLGVERAAALGGSGRYNEADALIRPLLDETETGSSRQFLAASAAADIALAAGRPADALALYAVVLEILAPLRTSVGELLPAEAIAHALFQLGRTDDAGSVLAVCDVVHTELSWPIGVHFAPLRDQIRAAVDPDRLEMARERAATYSTAEAFAWVGRLARGESDSPRRPLAG